jgi:HEAT repeat protein
MTDSNQQRSELAALLNDPTQFLAASNAETRRIAVAASLTHPALRGRLTEMMTRDPDSRVRRECAEVLGLAAGTDHLIVERALQDDVAEVREAAVTALGEIAAPDSTPILIARAADQDEDKLVREAAVAALGAIGDPIALPTLLNLVVSGPPQIRRRCVAALTVFDGDNVEAALRAAAVDRNPMVREAAEMVVGRTAD